MLHSIPGDDWYPFIFLRRAGIVSLIDPTLSTTSYSWEAVRPAPSSQTTVPRPFCVSQHARPQHLTSQVIPISGLEQTQNSALLLNF